MGKTWTRNPNDDNYRRDVKSQRKANKQDRKARRKAELVLDKNMERDDDGFDDSTDRYNR